MSELTAKLQNLRSGVSAFWQARNEQEQRMLAIGGAVVGLALFYSLLVAPAMDGSAQLRKSLPQLRQNVAELKSLARTANELAARAPLQAPPMTRAALDNSLAAGGIKPQSLSVTGEYAKLEFKGVPFAALVTWLDAQRRDGRIAVQEAVITGQTAPGMVDANLTLHQIAGGQ